MVALVTGATGLVGHAVVRALTRRARPVRALVRNPDKARAVVPSGVDVCEGDVTDRGSVERVLDDVDVIYHAAGLPEQWLRDPSTFERVNVGGTQNMVDAALRAGVKRFVYTSTIDVFRAEPGEEFDESELDPAPKGTHYERSKQEADRRVRVAIDRGLDAVFLHPCAVYGPGPAGSPGVNAFVDRIGKGKAPGLLPGGMAVVFSDDVGEAHVRAEQLAPAGARYILADRYVTLEELARIAADAQGAKVPRVLPLVVAQVVSALTEGWARLSGQPPLVPKGQLHFLQWGARPNAERARRELDMSFVPVEEGIRRLVGQNPPGPGHTP